MLKTRQTVWLSIAALMLLAIIVRALPGPRTIDDAFITFRYSRNLVEGHGFVYNLGVQTLGTTTPLFTLWMSGISLVTGGQDFQWYAIAVSALADAVTCALLFLLTRHATGSTGLGILLGVLWAISPRSVTFAVGGMETSVNILWMLAAVSVYVLVGESSTRAKWLNPDLWIGIFAALGLLTRIDAALWVAPLFAYQWFELLWQHRMRTHQDVPLYKRIPWRTWLACALVISPWLIFSTFYFGSPLPNSLSAKSVAYVMPPGTAFITLALQNYAVPFFESQLFAPGLRAIVGLACMTLYLMLSLMGMLYIARRVPRLLPFLIYPWLYLTVFSIVNPLIFRWYVAPPLPALTLGICIGLWAIIEAISQRIKYFAPVAIAGLGLFWGVGSLNAWTLHPDHGLDRPAPIMAWHQIELYYQQIGMLLRENYGVTPETRVASADIGAIGYFSRATIVDTVGLVTPELRQYYPVSPAIIAEGQNYAVPPALIFDTQPQYFVTMEAFVRLGLEQESTFNDQYLLLEEIPTDFYGTGMRLYGQR